MVRIFSHSDCILSEYSTVFPYSVRMLETTNQKNSEYEHFSRSESLGIKLLWNTVKAQAINQELAKNSIVDIWQGAK